MRIGLVVGHDVIKQGASSHGMTEFGFNDELILSMWQQLPIKHEFHRFYRSADIKGYNAQMSDLHRRLKNWGCELAIEFHLNDFHNKNVDGHEVLAMSDNSMEYAEMLNDSFKTYLQNDDRGAKRITSSENGYGFLSRGSYPCIITEPFFITQIPNYVYGADKRGGLIKSYVKFFEGIE